MGLLSPYMERRELARLRRKNNYTEAELIAILRQTCDAIRHLHHEGIIHGDIKPENILVSPDGTALLSDFGLAKSTDFVDTAPNHIGAGSGSFIAPEHTIKGYTASKRKKATFLLWEKAWFR